MIILDLVDAEKFKINSKKEIILFSKLSRYNCADTSLMSLHLYLFCSVAPGFEAMKDQNICNKIMVKLIQNFNNIFGSKRVINTEHSTFIVDKVL